MALKTTNPELNIVKKDWLKNPLTQEGNYTNLHGDEIRNIKDVWAWKSKKNPYAPQKKDQKSPLQVKPIVDIQDKHRPSIIPLGHASFIIDIQGYRILIDPIIVENRFLKRFTAIPLNAQELTQVDYLLLSHNHRDHIDKKSVQLLCKQNPDMIILTGLEIKSLLLQWDITNSIQEAGWYQQYDTPDLFKIDYLPSHHWSRRWITDTNIHLWGSFMIHDTLRDIHIYFASDSGYAPHFQEIGNMYKIDIAMIGIGAYEPIWFMKPAHTSPQEALHAFQDLKAKTWIPMHYGTFDLSDEPIGYPEYVLRTEFPESLDSILWMNIGERIPF
jgi:L-ascorbate metabolism protein UlaG (beta-lactamase superfamily)